MNDISPRYHTCAAGILTVLQSGGFQRRSFFVQRFLDAGYVQHLAERHADRFIAQNLARPWQAGGFDVRGTGEDTAYGFFLEYTAWLHSSLKALV